MGAQEEDPLTTVTIFHPAVSVSLHTSDSRIYRGCELILTRAISCFMYSHSFRFAIIQYANKHFALFLKYLIIVSEHDRRI
jgi:hypothetical protein